MWHWNPCRWHVSPAIPVMARYVLIHMLVGGGWGERTHIILSDYSLENEIKMVTEAGIWGMDCSLHRKYSMEWNYLSMLRYSASVTKFLTTTMVKIMAWHWIGAKPFVHAFMCYMAWVLLKYNWPINTHNSQCNVFILHPNGPQAMCWPSRLCDLDSIYNVSYGILW